MCLKLIFPDLTARLAFVEMVKKLKNSDYYTFNTHEEIISILKECEMDYSFPDIPNLNQIDKEVIEYTLKQI